MKLLDTYIEYKKIIKEFKIELDNGDEIKVLKSIEFDDTDYDNDYSFDPLNKKKFEALSEAEKERLINFIGMIKL